MTTPAPTRTEADAIADVARRTAAPVDLYYGDIKAWQGPDGTVHVVDLNEAKHRRMIDERPGRKVGRVELDDSASLIEYVKAHAEPDRCTLYADVANRAIAAVLNGHHLGPVPEPDDEEGVADEPGGWGDHTATVHFRYTPEWQRWAGSSGRYMPQEEFAEFVEENGPEIVEPDAATMLELVSTIEATKGATMRSSTRLSDGQVRVRYEETIETRAGAAGELTYPSKLTLGIAPFVGSMSYRVTARLRHRIRDGRLVLAYFLDRPEAVVEDAFRGEAHHVADETGRLALFGTPPTQTWAR